MKPHLVIKARAPMQRRAPHWRELIRSKGNQVTAFEPNFDALMASVGARFWVTCEYQPAQRAGWSREEARAGLDRIYRVILQQSYRLPPWLVERIRLNPAFESVRPIQIGGSPLPNVSLPQSRLASARDLSRDRIDLAGAHLLTRGDAAVRIAVLDTGVDLTHPEVASRIVGKADFVNIDGLDTSQFVGDFRDPDDDPRDDVGHGTHVAGIIAGRGDAMPVGVAPGCTLLAVRVLAAVKDGGELVGAGLVDNINAGIKWAVDNGADVINMSLGVRHDAGGLPHEEIIRYALAQGVTVVAASGNDGKHVKYYPGALPGVFAIGAANESGAPAEFTSYGSPVLMTAPGADVLSSYREGSYALCTGTSQAAPFVSGAVALLKSLGRSLGVRVDNALLRTILARSADLSSGSRRTPREGYGCLNVADACRLLKYVIEDRISIAAA